MPNLNLPQVTLMHDDSQSVPVYKSGPKLPCATTGLSHSVSECLALGHLSSNERGESTVCLFVFVHFLHTGFILRDNGIESIAFWLEASLMLRPFYSRR